MPTLLLKVYTSHPKSVFNMECLIIMLIMFFSTPGPTKSTVSDFWQMIWDQNCSSIVMLTNIDENGRVCGEGSLFI